MCFNNLACGESYQDRIMNEAALQKVGTRPLADVVAEKHFRFAGHILRLPPHHLAKIPIIWFPRCGKQKQG